MTSYGVKSLLNRCTCLMAVQEVMRWVLYYMTYMVEYALFIEICKDMLRRMAIEIRSTSFQ